MTAYKGRVMKEWIDWLYMMVEALTKRHVSILMSVLADKHTILEITNAQYEVNEPIIYIGFSQFISISQWMANLRFELPTYISWLWG